MEEIAAAARRYISIFGADAIYRVDADLSRAIGQKRWDEYSQLRKVKLRIQRLKAISAAEYGMVRLIHRARIRPSTSYGHLRNLA